MALYARWQDRFRTFLVSPEALRMGTAFSVLLRENRTAVGDLAGLSQTTGNRQGCVCKQNLTGDISRMFTL